MKIPEGVALSETEQQHLHQLWDTYNGVLYRLAQEGFKPLGTPNLEHPGYLDFDILTSHDSKVLTREMAKNKSWRDFAGQRLTYTNMILTQTQNELASIEKNIRKRLRKNSGRKTLNKDEILEHAHTNPRYEQLKKQEQENQQLKDYYESEYERLKSNYSLISRVVTMRGQDIEQGNRAINVGAHGTGAGHPGHFP